MSVLRRTILFVLVAGLLAGCSGGNASIWGDPPTPTPFGTQIPTPVVIYSLLPTVTFTPSPTPLKILPQVGTPTLGPALPTPTLAPLNTSDKPLITYKAQGGDTLNIVAKRFGVLPNQIISNVVLPPADKLIDPGTLLLIPDVLSGEVSPNALTIPDSEVVYSPSTIDFDVAAYINGQGGYLSQYKEYLATTAWTDGAQDITRASIENSINPRILLAILEYESHWVRSNPTNISQNDYPLGYQNFYYKGLFRQMIWAVDTLSVGYYGWRAGTLTELTFPDGSHLRLAPNLNAGTAAIQYFFAQTHNQAQWENIVSNEFPALYKDMFGDPWQRAQRVEPLIPAGLQQPPLSLPFEPGKVWSFTGGPHGAWEDRGAMAALDFAPASDQTGCMPSNAWVLAPSGGVIVRSENGVVMLDLDGDGHEQTGWDIMFLHIATKDRIPVGRIVVKDDKIGHPSCEGGIATGTHVHIVRKYNGEWILADGPLPFDLSGWIAHGEGVAYKGTLTRGDKTITACSCGSFETNIVRGPND